MKNAHEENGKNPFTINPFPENFTSKPLWILLEAGLILLALILIDCKILGLNCLDMKVYFTTKFLNRLALLFLILSFFQLMNRSFRKTLGFKNLRVSREIAFGILIGIILILISIGLGILSEKIEFLRSTDSNDPEFITSNMDTLWHLAAWILLGILAGGFMEEIIRIYLFLRIERLSKTWFSLLCTSILFGLGHWYRTGLSSFMITSFVAFVLTGVFLLRKRSIIAPIAAHACGDTIGFILSYISVHYGQSL